MKKNKIFSLPENIAPKQTYLGVMLPYSPIHELLFQHSPELLVMTSANINSLPLEYNNESALNNISDIADFFILHNRDIHIPIDDSVVKIINNEVKIIRRGRGYVPEPVKHTIDKSILSCGSDMKNTFCISKDNFLFSSQHNGDLKNLETLDNYKRNIEHFKKIFKFQPEFIACDFHPDYASRKYAEEYNLPLISVQHHHAHIASCMAENHIDKNLIGIAFDGTGYGTDGAIWGGEFFICDLMNFKRFAHLEYVLLPGGEAAVKEPWRMAVSYLNHAIKDKNKLENLLEELFGKKAITINSLINSKINCIETSSMGRFFDAVSAILSISTKVTYEGQASIELEAFIDENFYDSYEYEIVNENSEYIIKTSKIILGIVNDLNSNIKTSTISAKFHNTVINFSLDICNIIKETLNINEIALSGGVFQNNYIYEKLTEKLKKDSFIVYTHKDYPCNDGGISLGQIAIANKQLNKI